MYHTSLWNLYILLDYDCNLKIPHLHLSDIAVCPTSYRTMHRSLVLFLSLSFPQAAPTGSLNRHPILSMERFCLRHDSRPCLNLAVSRLPDLKQHIKMHTRGEDVAD